MYKGLIECGIYADLRGAVAYVAESRRSSRSYYAERWAESQAAKAERARKEARKIPARVRRDVLLDNCTYCGDWSTTVDHIVPVAQGGRRNRRNLTAACRRCNFEKLDFTAEQWQAWRLEEGLPWPPQTRAALIRQEIDALVERYGEETLTEMYGQAFRSSRATI